MVGDANRLDRRRFLQSLGAGALATMVASKTEAGRVQLSAGRPRVVVVRAKKALLKNGRDAGYDADHGALRAMLAAGLIALSGQKNASAALANYFHPGERIGLKVNGLAGRKAATHVELVDELSVMLGKADFEGRQQIVFDRFTRDLTASGFGGQPRGYRCVGNDEAGHEQDLVQMPSSASCLSRVLTTQVDCVLNLPILKQHMLAGMTGALKNNFGCIHNPNKMHLDGCDPYIAEVNTVPAIRDKQRLVIMDALRPVIDNGPAYQPGMAEVANVLIFATDLVAADTVGLGILEELRAKRGLPTLAKAGMAPTYLATASKMGLGVSDRAGIDSVTIEV